MYTQCPSCGTVFAVRAWQLRKAAGWVSCGLCQAAFDALEALAEELPEGAGRPEAAAAPPADRPAPASEAAPAAAGAAEAEAERQGEPYIPALEEEGAAATGGTEDWDALFSEIAPAVERQSAPQRGRGRPRWRTTAWRWGVAALGVALLAAGAVHGSYLYRAQLEGVPGVRPWLEAVCAVYGCTLGGSPAYQQDLEVEHRRLERHPQREDALVLGAEVRYTGSEPAPFPQMRLTLRDLDGHVTGQRWIGPEDYIADGRLRARLTAGMQPGMRIPVRLAVAEPEGGAESFSLAFRAPPQ